MAVPLIEGLLIRPDKPLEMLDFAGWIDGQVAL
jgi:hypothetical protein